MKKLLKKMVPHWKDLAIPSNHYDDVSAGPNFTLVPMLINFSIDYSLIV